MKKLPPNPYLKLKRPPRPKILAARAVKLKNESDQPPFFIRGQQAGSKDEYWVSLALDMIEWGWAYQVPVNGGRLRRGGNVVDFLVYTPGMWTIIEPMGRVWHTGTREDRFQMEDLARSRKWKLIAYFTDEPQVRTKEGVYSFLKSKLR
jgi:hypothetical protein